MTRYRITVRGTDIELRGIVDGEPNLFHLTGQMEDFALVIASEAPDDYSPFGITEPENPPSLETSIDILTSIAASSDGIVNLIENFASLHYGQAVVIRNERFLRERAEAEQRDRELHHFETEQMVAGASAVAEALEQNWVQGNLADAVNNAIDFLRRLESKA